MAKRSPTTVVNATARRKPQQESSLTGEESWLTPPTTRDELHAWIQTHLGVTLASTPVMLENNCPMDYIEHAFFAGVHKGKLTASRQTLAAPIDSVVWAHRGGGKTFLGAIATVLDLVFRPGIEVRILGGSMDQSKRMHAHLQTFFGSLPADDHVVDDQSDPTDQTDLLTQDDPSNAHQTSDAPSDADANITSLPAHTPRTHNSQPRADLSALVARMSDKLIVLRNGSRVELLAQSERSVRGTRVQRLRCDEVDMFKSDVWEAAQLVTRSKQCGPFAVRASVECLSTMHNPSGVMDRAVQECHRGVRRLIKWGVVDSLEHCGDDHTCTSANGLTCPLLAECAGKAKATLVRGHVRIDDAILMKRRVALRTWQSEMLCHRPRRDGVVLEEFDACVHIVRDDVWNHALEQSLARGSQSSLRWLYGMDFGFRAPTVALVGAVLADEQGKQSTLWIVDEWVREKMVLSEHIQAITTGLGAWPSCEWIGVDPAGHATNDQTGKSAVQAMREAGLVVKATRTTVEDGLNLLRARLLPADAQSSPRLFIHARCEKLLESMQNYRYGEGAERTVPQKDGHDHAVDALRYLVSNLDRPANIRVRGY